MWKHTQNENKLTSTLYATSKAAAGTQRNPWSVLFSVASRFFPGNIPGKEYINNFLQDILLNHLAHSAYDIFNLIS